jgi:hypothetical protein
VTLIISSGDGNAKRVDPSGFEYEEGMQQYIKEHPESIPLYEVKEDINLLVLAREFPTNSGPIDALAVDKDGDLYVIETKLYNNSDKRKVLAQALDYGAALWKHVGNFAEFKQKLNQNAKKSWDVDLDTKLAEHFQLEDVEVSELLENMEENLDDGILKFVVLMDALDDRLKDLVIYVNQNSQFDVYAVEMKHYEHEAFDIMLPRLFGAEVKKDINVSSSSNRKSWNDESFFADLNGQANLKTQKAVQDLYDYCQENADEISWGTGVKNGSFIPRFYGITDRSIFIIYSNGHIKLHFAYMNDKEPTRKAFIQQLTKELGIDIPADTQETSFYLSPEMWVSKKDEFIKIIDSLREDLPK